MTEEKGLDPAAADKIGEYVKRKGSVSCLGLTQQFNGPMQAALNSSNN
jgi:hypothetical protein